MGDIILSGINWLFIVTGILGVVGIIFLIPAVIVFAVLVSNEKDEVKRKSKIKKGIFFLSSPFILVVFSLIGVVIVKFVQTLLVG